MRSQRSLSQVVPGLVFALIVVAGVIWTVISSAARKNEAAAQAAEAARQAQVQAAEQTRQNDAARVADLPRVKRGIIGEWAGLFGSQSDARLTISKEHRAISGVLRSASFREVFRGEILPDNRLMLTPLSVKKKDGSDAPRYNLDTLWLELATNGTSLKGSYRDTRNSGGAVSLMRTSAQPESATVAPPTSTSTAAPAGNSTSNKIAELHSSAGEIDIPATATTATEVTADGRTLYRFGSGGCTEAPVFLSGSWSDEPQGGEISYTDMRTGKVVWTHKPDDHHDSVIPTGWYRICRTDSDAWGVKIRS